MYPNMDYLPALTTTTNLIFRNGVLSGSNICKSLKLTKLPHVSFEVKVEKKILKNNTTLLSFLLPRPFKKKS